VVTRKFKQLPNKFIRSRLQIHLPNNIDGEIILRNGSFNDIQSQVMSFDGSPDFIYCAFDFVKDSLEKPYSERIDDLIKWHTKTQHYFVKGHNFVKILVPRELRCVDEVNSYEAECLALDHEGIILRSPEGRYKCGRSTLKEGILIKVKRFKDSEAIVIGFQEKMHNDNVQEVNEFGLSKRSSKKEGMVQANTLGALLVRDVKTGQEFNIGSGMDDAMRKEIWSHQKKYLNKLVTYKHQLIGEKDLPRFPVFKSFRNKLDL
jgi:DNA ligase-1